MRTWIAILVVLTVGCVSAQKRYDQAQQAEAEGRWEAAADLYIDALKRDPELPGARDRLKVTGGRALDARLELVREFGASSRFEQAAREYVRIDGLVDRAAAVRVVLKTPADYAGRRRTVFDRAIEQMLEAADRLATEGRHQEAATAYRGAVAKYNPTAKQQDRARIGRYAALVAAATLSLDEGRYDAAHAQVEEALGVHGRDSARSKSAVALEARILDARYRGLLASVQERMREGHYQDAYALVGQALDVYGPEADVSADARDLRDQVIADGSVRVAALPVWRTERVAGRVPAGLLDELNDLLDDKHWTEPPLFIAPYEAKSVRGELRGLEFDRLVLTDRQARTVGKLLGAHFTVVTNVAGCAYDRKQAPRAHSVKTRDGPPAEILVYPRRTLAVQCVFRIVRVDDGQLIAEGTVSSKAERRLKHAVYDGDMRGLLLTREEHKWFDEHRRADADRELERETAAALADGVAGAIFEELLRHLP